MIMRNTIGLAVAALLLGISPTKANDSAAAIGAGGIVLVQQGDVAMVSEDLFVAKDKIRVRYEFRNDGKVAVSTLVAFPLPELDLTDMQDRQIGWPSEDQNDPTKFLVTVDGKSVKPKLERKAFLKGKDVTADLVVAGVPVIYPFGDFWDQVKKVKKADIDRLAKKGIVEVIKETGEVNPKWTLKNTYYWQQTFPPGAIVNVEHEYAPVVGGSFWSLDGYKSVAEIAKDEYLRDFCIDQTTFSTIQKRLNAQKAKDPNGSAMLSYIDIRYILKTGRNWKGPIGKFRLTVDKGSPANLVSFCATGVQKSGPTTFVVEHGNWEPDADLAVMILQPMQ